MATSLFLSKDEALQLAALRAEKDAGNPPVAPGQLQLIGQFQIPGQVASVVPEMNKEDRTKFSVVPRARAAGEPSGTGLADIGNDPTT